MNGLDPGYGWFGKESNVFVSRAADWGMRPTVLAVGGLDPSGGAGLAVDLAAIRAAGAHGAAVLAVSTVQTGERFSASVPERAQAVVAAVESVLGSQDVRAVKTGALGDGAVAAAISEFAGRAGFPPLVVDPVLASTTGGALLDAAGAAVLRDRLIPRAALVTPNLAEAAALSGELVADVDGMRRAAAAILGLGCRAVLVKGGHLAGGAVVDVLATRAGTERLFHDPRLDVGEVRGTGCALAALIAAHLALGADLDDAVERSRLLLRAAMGRSYAVGPGPRILDLDRRGLDRDAPGRES
jgi:hydroxymethylpyrimidine/phosphomethylpyrimidine kinase